MTNYTRTLDEITANDLPLVGGKGLNLGVLTVAKLPVPIAYCVTTTAYKEMIEASSLRQTFLGMLDGLNYEDVGAVESCAEAIREKIMAAPIPQNISLAIQEGYEKLEEKLGQNVLVSVRSSATAEDLPGMSFAGQQDTYLNIRGTDNVIHHVKRCWASLWTGRAVSYRHRQGFKHEDVFLAVVVQEMFPSEVAGVLFTINPLTSNPNEIFLNASWGLGEAIVSGMVNPDQYIIDKHSLALKDKVINEKMVMTARREDGQGSQEVPVPEAQRSIETMPADKVKELCQIAVKIEALYGFPQDIEWGYANGRFAILQAREVTATNYDVSEGYESWQSPEALRTLADERWLWSRAFSDESQTGSSTPLFHSYMPGEVMSKKLRLQGLRFSEQKEFLGFTSDRFEDIPFFRRYCARAYYNLNVEKERIRRFVPPFARDEATLYPFPAEQREKIKNMPFNWIGFTWLILKLHITNPTISLIETPYHLFENLENWVNYAESMWAKFDIENATTKEILALREKADAPNQINKLCTLPFTIYLFVLPQALKKLLATWCNDPDPNKTFNRLVSGIHTKTHEENIAVWRLSRKIKASPVLMELFQHDDVAEIFRSLSASEDGAKFKEELNKFIKIYGHRGGAERDPIHHRWRHKPEMVFHSIRPMLALDEAQGAEVMAERALERMHQAKENCLQIIKRQAFGSVKAVFFNWFVELVQEYTRFRDFERFYNDVEMSRPRDIYTAIARKFIARGLMTDEEDIFFLSQDEVIEVDDGKLSARDIDIRVRARRRVFDKFANREPPKYLCGWTTFDDDEFKDDNKGLRGLAASSGSVTGRARVCRRLQDIGSIQKGDILVTVATDPGWTSVFAIIGGVVVETGGVTAHAVMISREYDLPCVSNLSKACELIPQGSLITVNGSNGRVIIHEEAPVLEPAQ